VCLLTDELETRHATITVNVAGAQCPAMGKRPKLDAAAGGEDGTSTVAAAPEPFAREAKHFTECRLLHREVRVVFEGADKYDNLHVTVLFAENGAPVDVAAALVSEGLAKVVDWSVALMTDPIAGAQRLRAAERKAKDARARIWKTYTPPASSMRCVLYTGPHTTALAMWTPILKDFSRRLSAPTPRFQSPSSAPFNSN
jgi:staphylococcal nuclease domain-containing protein 1